MKRPKRFYDIPTASNAKLKTLMEDSNKAVRKAAYAELMRRRNSSEVLPRSSGNLHGDQQRVPQNRRF